MKLGIVSVRGPEYHPNGRLLEAAAARGHAVVLIHPYRVWPVLQGGAFTLAGAPQCAACEVVLPRQGAEIGDSCVALLRHLEAAGTRLVNGVEAILRARDKFRAQQVLAGAGLPVPDTVFLNDASGLGAAWDQLGGPPLVAKPVRSRQGTGVRLLQTAAEGEVLLRDHLQRRSGLLLQRFVPPQARRDLRAFVLGERVLAAAELQPRSGDFRANFHLAGTARAVALDPELEKLALRAAAAVGLEIAGVDLLLDGAGDPWVIETNYAPGFRGLEAATGLDVAGAIVDHAAGSAK